MRKPHMSLSYYFPCKAVLRANVLLKMLLLQAFLRKTLFFCTTWLLIAFLRKNPFLYKGILAEEQMRMPHIFPFRDPTSTDQKSRPVRRGVPTRIPQEPKGIHVFVSPIDDIICYTPVLYCRPTRKSQGSITIFESPILPFHWETGYCNSLRKTK